MRFLNKSILFTLYAAYGLLATSCQKEDQIRDSDLENPEIVLDLPENTDEIFGEITFKATVKDSQGIEKVSFFLNDELIGEAINEPFEILWNSGEVEDGTYILKVLATAKSGKTAEVSREIKVHNAFMRIHMEEGYRINALEYDFSEDWFFLSDKEGKIIGAPQKLIPGETITWNRPEGFTDDKVMVNHFTYENRESTIRNPKKAFALHSYPDIPPSDILLAASYPELKELGNTEINIRNNLPAGPDFSFSARTAYGITPPSFAEGGEPLTLTPAFFETEQQKCLVTYTPTFAREGEDRVPHFYWMDVQAGNSVQISTDQFLPMKPKEKSRAEGEGSGDITLYGYLENSEQEYGFNVSNTHFRAGSLSEDLYFPEEIFSSYKVYGSISVPYEYFYSFRLNTIPEMVAKPDFTATVTNPDVKNFELTTSGEYDVLSAIWSYHGEEKGIMVVYDRRLYLGKEVNGPYVLPDVPEELKKEYPFLSNPIRYVGTMQYDYQDITSYQEFFNARFGSKEQFKKLYFHEYLLLLGNKTDGSGARSTNFQERFSAEMMGEHARN